MSGIVEAIDSWGDRIDDRLAEIRDAIIAEKTPAPALSQEQYDALAAKMSADGAELLVDVADILREQAKKIEATVGGNVDPNERRRREARMQGLYQAAALVLRRAAELRGDG